METKTKTTKHAYEQTHIKQTNIKTRIWKTTHIKQHAQTKHAHGNKLNKKQTTKHTNENKPGAIQKKHA